MTSENSSFINFRGMQKNLFRRRLWVIMLALLVFVVYHVGFTIFALLSAGYSVDITRSELAASLHGTLNGFNWFAEPAIAVVGAVILGTQGFSWMDRKAETDLYESLPVSRKKRYWNTILNSFFIYIGAYLVTLAVGLVIIFGWGGGSSAVFFMELRTFLESVCLFTAVYAVSVFSVMMTGNLVVAVFLAAVVIAYEPAFDFTMMMYCSEMLKTYISEGTVWTNFFSPVAAFGNNMHWLNLAEGAGLTVLTYFLYMHRKNEDAGKAVIYAPVRWVLKIAVSVLTGLVTGLLFYEAGGTAAGAVAAFVTAAAVGCVMEVIYDFNVRKALRNPAGTFIAAAGAAVILICFRFDVAGYDSWTPYPSQVASAYVMDADNYINYMDEKGNYYATAEEYAKNYMKLTDIDAVNALLKEGERQTRAYSGNYDNGEFFTVGYRMKDGRLVRRQVFLKYTSTDVLDPVIGSQEFREGYFQVWNDSFLEKHLNRSVIGYWNGLYVWDDETEDMVKKGKSDTIKASGFYEAFKKAYKEDLKNFTFSYANTHDPIGQVEIETRDESAVKDPDESSYWYVYFTVYENFRNTISFLKEHGLYQEPVDKADQYYESTIQNLDGPFRDIYGYDS